MKNFVAYAENDAQHMIKRLKEQGYKRIRNCYWYETYAKENDVVSIQRDF